MRKYFTLFFSVCVFLSACKNNKAPDGIIDHDRMISLLTDVHILDGRMYAVKQEPDSLYKYGYGRYQAVFKKYRVDSVQFRKSVKYYSTQPDELAKIYDDVLASLKKKLDSVNKSNLRLNNAVPKQ